MCALQKGFFLGSCLLYCLLLLERTSATQTDVPTTLKKIKECVASDQAIVCLKEQVLDVLNETIQSEKPINIYGVIDIVKNPDYIPVDSIEENFLPRDLKERSAKLNDMLYDKVEDFLESRTIQIRLGDIMEGRGKKDKNKGGMLMMGGLAMAGMMAQLFMGKIAFMAGAALLLAKLALMLSTVIGFKKLAGGGGGGESTQVVYSGGATDGGNAGGHSHGGWYRSIAGDEAESNPYLSTENNPYRAYETDVAAEVAASEHFNNNFTY